MWYCHLLSETVATTTKSTRIFKDFNNAMIRIKKKCKKTTNRWHFFGGGWGGVGWGLSLISVPYG
jgi:hypothetical protein